MAYKIIAVFLLLCAIFVRALVCYLLKALEYKINVIPTIRQKSLGQWTSNQLQKVFLIVYPLFQFFIPLANNNDTLLLGWIGKRRHCIVDTEGEAKTRNIGRQKCELSQNVRSEMNYTL